MKNALTTLFVSAALLMLSGVLVTPAQTAQQSALFKESTAKASLRQRYEIQLKLDFDERTYTGSERVRWINRGDHATSVLYFHLYSNVRSDLPAPSAFADSQTPETEEPRVEILGVHAAIDGAPLNYSLEQDTTLRVNLRDQVTPGQAIEIVIGFKGRVPEVDPDQTGLTTHVVKQISAALLGDREMRRARDLNFRCRGVMLLGTFYPVLAVHDGDDWVRRLEPSVGDMIFNEVADYEVRIAVPHGISVFTSAGVDATKSDNPGFSVFAAPALRDFAIIAGRNLRSEQRQVGATTLRSIFIPEHERVGQRVLSMAEDSVKVFTSKFGPLPFRTINIAEAPLVAGVGSTEFAGMQVIASAFYMDFDSPAVRNLPEIIREQRPSVEESLEWSVAHLIAHQWWGAAVGNDPAREPVLDEAMASWSALLYFQEIYGDQKAASVLEDQLQGVYRLYRTLGGEDMNANRPSRDYRNTFQYAAVVTTKGTLMLVQLQRLLGREKLLAAFRNYFQSNLLEIAELEDLRGAVIAEASVEQRRAIGRVFNRWLASKRGDDDIAKPDQELATSLGLPGKANQQGGGGRNALKPFARVGKFFWQQITRIR
ncbi:MAG: M1 family aminopeptidase [Pyrinomonadaceae bacterium]